MSPAPDPNPDLWTDAAVSGGLGVLAGVVRWLMSDDKESLGYNLRNLLVAGITAYFAGLAISDVIDSEGLRFAAAGSTGYAGVALWELTYKKLKLLLDKWLS